MHALGDRDRLSALARTGLMDSGAEEAFDRYTRLASQLLDAPVALISLLDDSSQYFKSTVGIEVERTPVSHSFCRYVVETGAPLVIEDTRNDERLRDNPAVNDLGVIAYCGVPLTGCDGHVLGSLCAISHAPRAWSQRDVTLLTELATGVRTLIELRVAHRALASSEEQLRLTFDEAPIGMALVSPGGRFLRVNPALCEIVGYTEAELLELSFQDITHDEDLTDDLELVGQLLADKIRHYRLQKRYIHRDGHEVWIELSVALVRDGAGEPLHFVAQIEDITERRAVEAERQALKEKQSVLLASLPDTMVLLFDRELRIGLIQGTLTEEGFDPQRFVGRPATEMIPAPRFARLKLALQGALEGRRSLLEYSSVNGKTYSVEVAPYREAGKIAGAFTVWRDVSERIAQERSTRWLATIVAQSDDAVYVKDRQGIITEWNPGAERLYGYPADEAIGRPVSMLIPFDRAGEDRAVLRRVLRGETVRQFETVRVHRDGRRLDVSISVSPIRRADGTIAAASVIARDITARIAQERARRDAEERLRVTVDHAPIGVALIDLDPLGRGALASANDTLAEMLGDPEPVLSGVTLCSIVHPDDVDIVRGGLMALACDGLVRIELEVRCLHGDGHFAWLLLAGAAIPSPAPGEPPRQAVFHVMDIGERKRFEGQLQHLADHDALTGLFNRGRFESELERAVAHSERYGSCGGVLLIDLDGFKYVNDTMGHSCGDELVTRIGGLLRASLRETDVVARIGGDEFAVIVGEVDEAGALLVADKLLDVVREGGIVVSDDRHATVTASIGVTTYDATSSLTPEELMVEADIAMYEAKEAGKNCAAAYRREEQDRGSSRLAKRESWLERLRQASANEGFELLAQPIVGICAQDVPHFELLLRLRSEDGDLIPPGTFLYNAERFDLVQGIDRWVFGRALELLRAHHEAGNDISLSVNMSGKTLNDPELLDDLSAMIAACPIPRNRLVVEVTETAAITNIEKAGHMARSLRELGVQFALDDFGAGFASFYYLKHLDFDYLKIDGEFVRSLARNVTDQLVIKSVVGIARGLGAKTIAEFVGDDDAVARLRELGVDFGQGYHLGRPGPLSERLPALSPDQLATAERTRSSSD